MWNYIIFNMATATVKWSVGRQADTVEKRKYGGIFIDIIVKIIEVWKHIPILILICSIYIYIYILHCPKTYLPLHTPVGEIDLHVVPLHAVMLDNAITKRIDWRRYDRFGR